MDHGFGNWVTMHAERSPDAIANIDALSGEERTYRQFEERSNALANALTQRGVQKGDRIAVLVMNSIEFVEIMIAIAKLGAITVPINYRLKSPEVEYILQDSGATVLLYSSMLQDLAQKTLTGETDVQHRISVPDSRSRADNVATDLEELVATADPSRVVQQVAEDDIAAIMYTSGTTGAPKGRHAVTWEHAVECDQYGDGRQLIQQVRHHDYCGPAVPHRSHRHQLAVDAFCGWASGHHGELRPGSLVVVAGKISGHQRLLSPSNVGCRARPPKLCDNGFRIPGICDLGWCSGADPGNRSHSRCRGPLHRGLRYDRDVTDLFNAG